jgi:hypothetical protein
MEDATKRALEDRAVRIARAQRKTTAEKLFDMTEPRGRPYLAALVCQLLGAFEQDAFLSFLEDYDGQRGPTLTDSPGASSSPRSP